MGSSTCEAVIPEEVSISISGPRKSPDHQLKTKYYFFCQFHQFGIDPGYLQKQIEQRGKVLSWMFDRDVTHYKDVARIFRLYYTRPEELLASI